MNERDPRYGGNDRPGRSQGRPQGPTPRTAQRVAPQRYPAGGSPPPPEDQYRAADMPLLTHDETGAASVARARAASSPVALEERTVVTGPPDGGGPAVRKPRKKRIWLRWVLGVVGFLIVAPFVAFAIGWAVFQVPTAQTAPLAQVATFTFADNVPVATVRPEQGNSKVNRVIVPLDKVPLPVRQAVLSAEDATFYSNPGFDLKGIVYAVYKQLTGGVGGGSTITQQYIKVTTGQDEASGLSGLWRKYKEVVLAVKISREQTKDQILENYLNTIYLGRGAYGIQAAAQAYFGKDVGDLTVAQGAMIAGIIQSPSRLDPVKDLTDVQARWTYVVDQMAKNNFISAADRTAATFPTDWLKDAPTDNSGGVPGDDRYHIYQAALAELAANGITEQQVDTEGLTVTTTVDSVKQKLLVDAVNKVSKGQPANLRYGAVSIDPRTGAVIAYYGGTNLGFDYANSSLTGGLGRQPGSSFKPFVLSAALQAGKGIGLGTQFNGTSPQTFLGIPISNSDGDNCDMCSLKTAMTKSINTVYYALAIEVGPQRVVDAAHAAGIPGTELPTANAGIALGDQEVQPIDMASAYATFAADGMHHNPYMVQKVVAADGRVLLDRTTPPGGTQAVSPQVARNVTESMLDVASSALVPLSGGRPVASKSGTVQADEKIFPNQNKDAWYVGYTPQISTAVWVGTDKKDPIKTSAGRQIYGRMFPGSIWQQYMNGALRGQDVEQFSPFEAIGTPPDVATTDDGNDNGDSADNGNDSADNGNDNGDNGDDGDKKKKKKKDDGDNAFFLGPDASIFPIGQSSQATTDPGVPPTPSPTAVAAQQAAEDRARAAADRQAAIAGSAATSTR